MATPPDPSLPKKVKTSFSGAISGNFECVSLGLDNGDFLVVHKMNVNWLRKAIAAVHGEVFVNHRTVAEVVKDLAKFKTRFNFKRKLVGANDTLHWQYSIQQKD